MPGVWYFKSWMFALWGGRNKCCHNRNKASCKHPDCVVNASAFCPCGSRKFRCTKCKIGGGICKCGSVYDCCKVCNPIGHLTHTVSTAVGKALKYKKSKKSIKYLGCDISTYKQYLEAKFEDGMSWDNHGEWHIDHIVPLAYENPTDEEVVERLHYTNTQPLWATDNMSKGNRFVG